MEEEDKEDKLKEEVEDEDEEEEEAKEEEEEEDKEGEEEEDKEDKEEEDLDVSVGRGPVGDNDCHLGGSESLEGVFKYGTTYKVAERIPETVERALEQAGRASEPAGNRRRKC